MIIELLLIEEGTACSSDIHKILSFFGDANGGAKAMAPWELDFPSLVDK